MSSWKEPSEESGRNGWSGSSPGQEAVKIRSHGGKWIQSLTVITNNLPGIEALMESGRIDPHDRLSSLALASELLPGAPLPIYSAVVGKNTDAALRALREEERFKNGTFIGLVTGNWIRLRRTTPHCPIPLARGEGHLSFKTTLIQNSDEVFVLAPLGKIFVGVDPAEVNEALGLSGSNPEQDRKPYSEIDIKDDRARSVKLVSTIRPEGFVLSNHSVAVKARLEVGWESKIDEKAAVANPPEDLPHLLFSFARLPERWPQQVETEFPHRQTRREEFMRGYFRVPRLT